MPLKSLIKFSQSNQIILKSFLSPFAGLVSEPSRQVPKAGASGAAEGVQQQRAHHAREERKQVGHAEGREAPSVAPVHKLNDAKLECIIASVEQ